MDKPKETYRLSLLLLLPFFYPSPINNKATPKGTLMFVNGSTHQNDKIRKSDNESV